MVHLPGCHGRSELHMQGVHPAHQQGPWALQTWVGAFPCFQQAVPQHDAQRLLRRLHYQVWQEGREVVEAVAVASQPRH
jgi:hypothetical protein